MPVNPTAQQHIHKAKLFHDQWDGPNKVAMPLEWTFVVIYYEALHWYSAAVIHLHVSEGRPEPDVSLHRRLRDAAHEVRHKIPRDSRRSYEQLEALSRRARYEVDPANFVDASELKDALPYFEKVKNWAAQILAAAGYHC